MPMYITLVNWTDQGIRNVKESPARYDAYKEAARSLGVEVKDAYLVTGQYDLVVVSEAPDDETVAKLALTVGSLGNVRTETLRAFTEAEYRDVIAGLP